jgi:hypothetical protein
MAISDHYNLVISRYIYVLLLLLNFINHYNLAIMKRTIFTLLFIIYYFVSIGQNVFPTPSGKVGIGTLTPSASLEITNSGNKDALRVGINTNRANTITQLLNSMAVVAVDNSDMASSGAVAWDFYNNGSNPSWSGTLMQYSGTAVPGNAYGLPASNQGRLLFQNVLNGVIATNGVTDIFISPNNTISTSFLANGSVGIGTTNPGTFKLAVEGKIGAREVQVTATTPWPDYVFTNEYKLITIDSLNNYLQKVGHLPNMPSAKEVEENGGIELGKMNTRLLEKVEELTLYIIQLKKENDGMKKGNQAMNEKIEELSNKMSTFLSSLKQ